MAASSRGHGQLFRPPWASCSVISPHQAFLCPCSQWGDSLASSWSVGWDLLTAASPSLSLSLGLPTSFLPTWSTARRYKARKEATSVLNAQSRTEAVPEKPRRWENTSSLWPAVNG